MVSTTRRLESQAICRRGFLATTAAALATSTTRAIYAETEEPGSIFSICAFEKFLQDLSYEELADVIAELGFVGIEATVRNNGHVLPDRVEDDLPKLAEALRERDLEITIMTTDINEVDDPLTKRVLNVAQELGISRYRMANFKYDLSRPIWPQVVNLRPAFRDLAAMNQQYGVQGLYQNHSGYNFFGATLWDLYEVIKDLPPEHLGVAFDIRHAKVEAGLSWEVLYHLLRPHFGAVYVKDYRWEGHKALHAPLGTSINPRFFELLKRDQYSGPISLHVEYLPYAGVEPNVRALRQDLASLRDWLES